MLLVSEIELLGYENESKRNQVKFFSTSILKSLKRTAIN